MFRPPSMPLLAATAVLLMAGAHAASFLGWSASQTYTGGETVTFNGQNYKAQWWTRGNSPATQSGPLYSGKVWLPIGKAEVTPPPAPVVKKPDAVSLTGLQSSYKLPAAGGLTLPLRWTMPSGVNGDHWRVLVDGKEVYKAALVSNPPASQDGSVSIQIDKAGTHTVEVQLCNGSGAAELCSSVKQTVAVVADVVVPPKPQPEGDAVTGEMLVSKTGSGCLARRTPTALAGDKVSGAPCDGADPRQRWTFNGSTLRAAGNNALCLSGALQYSGTLSLVTCDGGQAQQWMWTDGQLLNGRWALDYTASHEIIVWGSHGAVNQRWMSLSDLKKAVDAGKSLVVKYPVVASDGKAVELERSRDLLNRLTPPAEPLPVPRDVSIYPGSVPANAPRVTEALTLDRRFADASHEGWSQKLRNWLATGLYAPAGEAITVTVPPATELSALDGVFVRISPHTDVINRSGSDTIDRYSNVSLAAPLRPGVNYVRSQYGGLVILESRSSANVAVSATVSGAVRAPYFKLGKTSDWASARNAPAPWAVLEGRLAVVVVPSSQIRSLADAEKVMQTYDARMQDIIDLAGFDGSSAKHPKLEGKQWLVEDKQISAGYGHAGFPIMTMLDWKLATVASANGWGVQHETGHNYQPFCLWASRYGSESTVNLFSLYSQEKAGLPSRLINNKQFSAAITKLEKPGFDFDKDADVWDKLILHAQLRYAFPDKGWEIYRQLNRRYRELGVDEQKAICADRQKQADTSYELLSDISGADLTEHFQHWGVPVSSDAIGRVKAKGLKVPAAKTWLVNPEK
ncbi:M60 family metallopeptidase [Crenobacter cavernae]|uniref:Peptidase M60 domain-containing protein n=1 Tax=Crenobacter cavernae TaxID=2290923 RepID=A0ABY0FB74_9NEIS|nr:M60 family metallopeptidase [Crenobacter cavernae]RXZ43204.1 hypothetical protein EBB06_10580 [Crenobacter cavernae]